MDKIAVLIPCYNEAVTIENVVRSFRDALPESTIYIYDNNSTDDTARLAAAAGAIVRHEYRQGKGNVIRRMFREIDAQCYVLTDGDDTYPASCAPAMVRKVLEQQADMVVGDRLSSTYYEENTRPFHGLGNRIVRQSVNRLFHCDIPDVLTGYRAFSYLFVKSFPVLSQGFEIETEMTIHAVDKNMSVMSELVEYRSRPEGSESKLRTFSDGLKVLGTIFKLFCHYKPLVFFGWIALILAGVSIGFFIPVLAEYARTGLVPRFPTLIVCGLVMIAAIQSFFAGLILENIQKKSRQDFELELMRLHSREGTR